MKEKTRGPEDLAPPSTRPGTSDDDRTPTPEDLEPPAGETDDGSTTGGDGSPPPPAEPSPGGPEDFTLPPLPDQDIYRVPGVIPPVDRVSDGGDTAPPVSCPYDVKRSDSLVRDLSISFSSALPIYRAADLPVMQFTFCDRLPINSACSRIVVDPARDALTRSGQTFHTTVIRRTIAVSPESQQADKIHLSQLNHLQIALLGRSSVREIVLDDLIVEAQADSLPTVRVYDRRNILHKLLLDMSPSLAEFDFDSGCD